MQNMMEDLIEWLRGLFGMEKSVEKIVRPVTKIVDQLDKHASRQTRLAASEKARARECEKRAAMASDDANAASKLSTKYSELVG